MFEIDYDDNNLEIIKCSLKGTSFEPIQTNLRRVPYSVIKNGLGIEMFHNFENEHDPNAVEVYYQRSLIGYVPKFIAKHIVNSRFDYEIVWFAKVENPKYENVGARVVVKQVDPDREMPF